MERDKMFRGLYTCASTLIFTIGPKCSQQCILSHKYYSFLHSIIRINYTFTILIDGQFGFKINISEPSSLIQ